MPENNVVYVIHLGTAKLICRVGLCDSEMVQLKDCLALSIVPPRSPTDQPKTHFGQLEGWDMEIINPQGLTLIRLKVNSPLKRNYHDAVQRLKSNIEVVGANPMPIPIRPN